MSPENKLGRLDRHRVGPEKHYGEEHVCIVSLHKCDTLFGVVP